MAEQDDGPEQEAEGDEPGADAEDGAQGVPDGDARRAGYARDGRGRDREREEGAREEGQDGPELILPARFDGR